MKGQLRETKLWKAVALVVFMLEIFDLGQAVSIPFSRQVHIAFNSDNGENGMSISWVTYSAYSNEEDSLLYFTDTDPSTNNNNIKNISTTYNSYHSSIMVDQSRYYHHSIVTENLVAMKQYWYQCGSNGTIYSFTARQISKPTKSTEINIIMYGDMGIDHSNNTLQLVKDWIGSDNIDFIMHIGDIAYNDDRDLVGSNPQYIPVYDKWATEMEAVFNNTPYMVTPGNHEQTCHSWADMDCPQPLRNFSEFRKFWNMPNGTSMNNNGYYTPESSHNMFYSWNYQNIHFISISTESDYPGSPDQYKYHNDIINPEAGPFGDQMDWLKTDLLNANNNNDIDWIIAVGHRPLYTSSHTEEHLDWPPQTPLFLHMAFDDLFYQYNVDLYVSGHIHSYERLYPIYDGKITTKNYLEPKSTIFLVNGAAGCVEGHGPSVPLKNYTAVYDNHHWGPSKLTVYNETTLLWQYFDADTKEVFDSVWINKGHW